MNKPSKIACLCIFNTAWGYLAFFFFPGLLALAFNRTYGPYPMTDPDGPILMLPAWLLLILIPVIFIIANLKMIHKFSLRKRALFISVAALSVGAVLAIVHVNLNSAVNYTNLFSHIFGLG